jgi:hypothetical protein
MAASLAILSNLLYKPADRNSVSTCCRYFYHIFLSGSVKNKVRPVYAYFFSFIYKCSVTPVANE